MSDWSYSRQGEDWPLVATIKMSYSRSMKTLRRKLDRRRLFPSSTNCSTTLSRMLKHAKFIFVASASFLTAMAPCGLALLEVVLMTVLYCSFSPWLQTLQHWREYHYSFSESLEDVLLLSYIRFLVVLLAYLLGAGRRMMR